MIRLDLNRQYEIRHLIWPKSTYLNLKIPIQTSLLIKYLSNFAQSLQMIFNCCKELVDFLKLGWGRGRFQLFPTLAGVWPVLHLCHLSSALVFLEVESSCPKIKQICRYIGYIFGINKTGPIKIPPKFPKKGYQLQQ